MSFDINLKINNQDSLDYNTSIRIIDGHPVLNWDVDFSNKIVVDSSTGAITGSDEIDQQGYEIRISTYSSNIGTDLFVGNRAQTGYVPSQNRSWMYEGVYLERGVAYYGQMYVLDETGWRSDWITFSFLYNSLPYLSNVGISPSSPSVTDDLVLSYNFYDNDDDLESGTIIRWFRNGVYQRQFNNALTIQSSFLQNGDIWFADICPSDGYEYGERISSDSIMVKKTAVVVSNLTIFPLNPNRNDVLKASYVASDDQEKDNIFVRWYVNNVLVSSLNDKLEVRPSVVEGDSVRVEVKHVDSGTYVSSADVEIISSKFVVGEITIDGKIEPLNVSSVSPLVRWRSFIPEGKTANYVSIKIGTFYESSNVYSLTTDYNGNYFTIPTGVLERGRDYYISIALSDTSSFSDYASSHFRVYGNLWEESVSNSTGWTLETLVSVNTDSAYYHAIRINDGSKFAEIRIYKNLVKLISSSTIDFTYDFLNKASILTICGKGDDIKIYINRSLSIDGEGIFTQSSNIKRLEIDATSNSEFAIDYKYFFYTVSGYFLPILSSEYSNLQFHTYMEFKNKEIVALQGYTSGKYVFAANPDNDNESSCIYSIKSGSSKRYGTVSRTLSPVNKISASPDKKMTVCAHYKGSTIISGYIINPFNYELVFVDQNNNLNSTYPSSDGWELVSNTNFTAAYFDSDGLHINTIGK